MGNKYWDKNSENSYKSHISGVDMNRMHKIFATGMVGGYGKEIFSFAVDDGEEKHGYVTTPTTMKAIAKWMNEQITEYEEKYGEIKMEK